MKLIVKEQELILDTQEGQYTMKRAHEEDEWHAINEFVDLNFYYDADEDKYHAAIYLVIDGQTITHTEHKVDVEFA